MPSAFRRLLVCGLMVPVAVWAGGDLSDGISAYTDDSIGAADRLGSPEVNVGFIILRAKSQAASGSPGTVVLPNTSPPMGNINSVVLQPGSQVFGDIVIIDNSTAAKTQIITGVSSYVSGLGLDLTSWTTTPTVPTLP